MTRAWSKIQDAAFAFGAIAAAYAVGQVIGIVMDLVERRLS